MKPHKLTTFALAKANLCRSPGRTVGLALIAALLAFVLYGGTILTRSLENGLSGLNARFGADLVVVPLGYDGEMETMLLKGEPSYFYLERDVLDALREIPGVERLSAQFYLTSTGADCCSLPVQIIGIDPETDFTVSPWIRQNYGAFTKGTVLIGSDIQAEGDTLRFYGREYRIAGRLAATGTGMDQAVFAPMENMPQLLQDAKEKDYPFLERTDPENAVSAIFIQTAEGYDAETVTHNIRVALDGLQIIQTRRMISGMADSIQSLILVVRVCIVVFALLAVGVLAAVFTLTVRARRRELAVLRTLGATRGKLRSLLLTESAAISAMGSVLGVILAALAVFPFSVFIADRLSLAYIAPGIWEGIILAALCLLVSILTGPLAAAYSVAQLGKIDVYQAMREGE